MADNEAYYADPNVIKYIAGKVKGMFPVPVSNGGTGATNAADAIANLGVDAYPVDCGTSGSWSYIAWSNGFYEAWMKTDGVQLSTSAGGRYRIELTLPNFPVTFATEPRILITAYTSGDSIVPSIVTRSFSSAKIRLEALNATRPWADASVYVFGTV